MSQHSVNRVTSAYRTQATDDIYVQFSSQHFICQNTAAWHKWLNKRIL